MNVLYDTPEDAPPPGFWPLSQGGGFIADNGPIYVRRDANGVVFGFRVMPRHCNSVLICHGGWLTTMLDMVLPLGVGVAVGGEENFLLTVSMTIDYLDPAPLGAWVEGRSELLRRTRRLVFAQGKLTIAGEAIVRGSGIFRIGTPCRPLKI
jgi:acyl-coenzyme A thioesterase PaaI-like protein